VPGWLLVSKVLINYLSAYIRDELEAAYTIHDSQRQKILTNLEEIIRNTGAFLEGNSFYYHQTLNLHGLFLDVLYHILLHVPLYYD